jgi:ABC-type glutathione transport system ATPase component
MIIWGVVFFLVSLLIDFMQQRKFRDHDGLPRNSQAVFTLPPDEDVLKEEREVIAAAGDESLVVKVNDLYKQYNTVGVLPAVRGNTFGIRRNEVLGLLGPNGAGKSTTFSILTMEHQRTSGEAMILGQPIANFDCEANGKRLGLCA